MKGAHALAVRMYAFDCSHWEHRFLCGCNIRVQYRLEAMVDLIRRLSPCAKLRSRISSHSLE
jgi:hypothetical protein